MGNRGKERACEAREVSTIWDGEIARVKGPLGEAPRGKEVSLLADSQAAITSIKKAGRRGRARMREPQEVLDIFAARQRRIGEDAVTTARVKPHIEIKGNEIADEEARAGAGRLRWMDKGTMTEGYSAMGQGDQGEGKRSGEEAQQERNVLRKKCTTAYTRLWTGKGVTLEWGKLIEKVTDCRYPKNEGDDSPGGLPVPWTRAMATEDQGCG